MADEDPREPPEAGQILQADLMNHVRARVNREVTEIIDCADELRGLGASLDAHSGMEMRASPTMLREAAVGVRAVSMQAFISACRAAGISARLHAWADIVGIIDAPDPDSGDDD
jgi:hypothetical protein